MLVNNLSFQRDFCKNRLTPSVFISMSKGRGTKSPHFGREGGADKAGTYGHGPLLPALAHAGGIGVGFLTQGFLSLETAEEPAGATQKWKPISAVSVRGVT